MRFRDLNLGSKQIIGLGLVLLIMACANAYSLKRLASLKNEIKTVSTSWLPRVIALSHINLSTSELRANQLQLAFATERRDEQQAKIVELIDRVDENLDAYARLKASSEAQGLYSEAEKSLYEEGFDPKWEDYLDLSFAFLSLSAEGDSEGTVALQNGEAREVYEDFSTDLQELVRINNASSIEAAERAELTFHKARTLTLTLLIATLALSAVIAFALVRLISVPVRQLERAAHAVAERRPRRSIGHRQQGRDRQSGPLFRADGLVSAPSSAATGHEGEDGIPR